MADDLNELLRKKGVLGGMQISPTQNRPMYHEPDPKTLDEGLQKAFQYTAGPAMLLAGAAGGGPEALALKNLIPGLMEGALRPFTKPNPEVMQDIMYPVFHGTYKGFGEYNPELSEDIGIHLGSNAEQAHNRIRRWLPASTEASEEEWPGLGGSPIIEHYAFGYKKGANIRPEWADIESPVSLPDRFSVEGDRRNLVYDLLDHANRVEEHPLVYGATPGLRFSTEARQKMLDWAVSGQGTEKDLWKIVKEEAESKGHDAFVYKNQYEGPGDSYVIFDPSKVTPRFGRGSYSPSNLREPPMTSDR